MTMFKEILVAIDVNEESSWQAPFEKAVTLAQTCGAKLHIMSVVPTMGMPVVGQSFPRGFEETRRQESLKRLEGVIQKSIPADLSPQAILRKGTVYKEILAVAKEIRADLIVIGSHRPELSDFLIGPNAARVVRHAKCSALVVRS